MNSNQETRQGPVLIPQEVIRIKRDGGVVPLDLLRAFLTGFLEQKVEDYQVSAFLMATLLKGMNAQETADLTTVMRDSGKVLAWDYPRRMIVDKHSTGGIGDKTSLILLPLCILEGLYVPMIAGRGLGHTGGTPGVPVKIPGNEVFPVHLLRRVFPPLRKQGAEVLERNPVFPSEGGPETGVLILKFFFCHHFGVRVNHNQ
ncbi:hypothetical protein EBZ80_13420 [bacterium]|nr:hypothetical protein [bacterium]